jgi:hypothetical protein
MTTERRRRPVVAPATRILATGSAVAATLLLVGAMAEPPVDAETDAPVATAPVATTPPVVTVVATTAAAAPPATVRVAVPVPAAAQPSAPAPVPVTASHGSR